MWITILLISLLTINLAIGSYLYIKMILDTKKYHEEWCRKRIYWPWYRKDIHSPWRRKIVTGFTILNIACLPFAALFLPWDKLGTHIRTKLFNKHPYLANISEMTIVTVLSFSFYMLLSKYFFPTWSKSSFSLTTRIIIIGLALLALLTLAILNTRRELREQSLKTKKPG